MHFLQALDFDELTDIKGHSQHIKKALTASTSHVLDAFQYILDANLYQKVCILKNEDVRTTTCRKNKSAHPNTSNRSTTSEANNEESDECSNSLSFPPYTPGDTKVA